MEVELKEKRTITEAGSLHSHARYNMYGCISYSSKG